MPQHKKASSGKTAAHRDDGAYVSSKGRRGDHAKSLKHHASDNEGSKPSSKKPKYRHPYVESVDDSSDSNKPTQKELRKSGDMKYKPRATDNPSVKVGKSTVSDDSEDSDAGYKAKSKKKNVSASTPARRPTYTRNNLSDSEQEKRKKKSKKSSRRTVDFSDSSEDSDDSDFEKYKKKRNKKLGKSEDSEIDWEMD
ncbi:hypothetical protein Daesc_004665 [Daldinia eschscholtzii]|uniref:Uncharacterized protein n=1 Tax=Daldinia eschscholtzii TaxID=292717 RepID=A0AAX6MQL4_9PEZI